MTANGQTAKGRPTAQEQVREFKNNKLKSTKSIPIHADVFSSYVNEFEVCNFF